MCESRASPFARFHKVKTSHVLISNLSRHQGLFQPPCFSWKSLRASSTHTTRLVHPWQGLKHSKASSEWSTKEWRCSNDRTKTTTASEFRSQRRLWTKILWVLSFAISTGHLEIHFWSASESTWRRELRKECLRAETRCPTHSRKLILFCGIFLLR